MGALLRLVGPTSTEADPPDAEDLLESWREYLGAYGCATKTVYLRLWAIRHLMEHAAVDDPLELTRDHVVAWLSRPMKQWSRVTYFASVKAFSRWLREFKHDPTSDLVQGIPSPRSPEPVARPVTDAVVTRMLSLDLPIRPHLYVRLALYQALRVHEIAKVRAEDFDFAAGWMTVTGKGNVTKPIPIHPEVAKLRDRVPDVGYWFPSASSAGHVGAHAVSVTIRNVLIRCGSSATPHQLRDTAATRMQRQVKDIRLTQSMLRHRMVTSTQKYTAASNEDLQRAVKTLDWTDTAQISREVVPLPTVDGLSRDQMRILAAQLLGALADDAGSEL